MPLSAGTARVYGTDYRYWLQGGQTPSSEWRREHGTHGMLDGVLYCRVESSREECPCVCLRTGNRNA